MMVELCLLLVPLGSSGRIKLAVRIDVEIKNMDQQDSTRLLIVKPARQLWLSLHQYPLSGPSPLASPGMGCIV